MAREIKVVIDGDASKFQHATAQASHSALSIGAAAGIAASVATGAFHLLEEAAAKAAEAVMHSDEVFRADQASQALLGEAIKNNLPPMQQSQEAAERIAKNLEHLGFGALESRDALGQLIGVTHNLDGAQADLNVAVQFARAHHLSLAEATDIVAKASEGNFRALKKYGIELGAGTTAQQAMKAMLDQTKGSAEAYAKTSEGRLAIAHAKEEAAWVRIGAVVDRITSVVFPLVADALEQVSLKAAPLADWIQNHLFPAFQQVGHFLADIFGPDLKDIQKNSGDLIPVLEGVGKILLIVGAIVGAVALAIIKGILLAVKAIEALAKMSEDMESRGHAAWSGLAGGVRAAVNTIIGLLNNLIGWYNKMPAHFGGPDYIAPIPTFHMGGVVPGIPGQNVLAVLQAGETVTARGTSGGTHGGSGGLTIVNNFYGSFYSDGPALDRLSNRLANRLGYATGR